MRNIDLKTALIAAVVLLVIALLSASRALEISGGHLTFAVIALVLYFVPTLIALHRQHRQKLAIFALNLLLGWTFLGWAAAVVWSLTAQPTSPGENAPG